MREGRVWVERYFATLCASCLGVIHLKGGVKGGSKSHQSRGARDPPPRCGRITSERLAVVCVASLGTTVL
ncbi:hypothetical protein E2C01_036252 [Portunus trituberculatus]|uniref:Uncharacterized protein n=1 Tax=Portunus trituberculatus TaxID=210409 RepID=A0A5B7FBY8_PORTR|nr:hypothetical protein [Portunus trituberculatus]